MWGYFNMTALHDLLKDARNYLESIGYTPKAVEAKAIKVPKVLKKSASPLKPDIDPITHGMQIWFEKKIAEKKRKKEELVPVVEKKVEEVLAVDISPKVEDSQIASADVPSVISHIDAVSTGITTSSWEPDDLIIEFPLEVSVETEVAVDLDPAISLIGLQKELQEDHSEPDVVSNTAYATEPLVEEKQISFDEPVEKPLLEQTPEEIVLEAKERWLKEKKDLRLAKKREDSDLAALYNHKYAEFRKTIGTSW
jgi:hypothetical protein